MLSAICLNLDQSKILSSGNGLTIAQIMGVVFTSNDKVLDLYKFKTIADDNLKMTQPQFAFLAPQYLLNSFCLGSLTPYQRQGPVLTFHFCKQPLISCQKFLIKSNTNSHWLNLMA